MCPSGIGYALSGALFAFAATTQQPDSVGLFILAGVFAISAAISDGAGA